MNFSACTTAFGFGDPDPQSIQQQVNVMRERIDSEDLYSELNATDYEKQENHLKRFLTKHFMDLEVALTQWHGWVKWRHDVNIDDINEEEIKNEREEGVVTWRGRNKEGMLCCVITGRMLDPINRKGTPRSFKKFILKTVEEGLRQADESSETKVCIIYDRRGLEFKHIDPNLYQFCRKDFEVLRDYYGDRIGAIYVLYTNVFFWIMYHLILRPLSAIWTNMEKLIVVDKAEDLLEYFESDQLYLLSPDVSCDDNQPAATLDNKENDVLGELEDTKSDH
jgi:hypothetical protein